MKFKNVLLQIYNHTSIHINHQNAGLCNNRLLHGACTIHELIQQKQRLLMNEQAMHH
jgi:hypothetical protein